MSLDEEMCGCRACILYVRGGAVMGMSASAVDGVIEGSGLTQGVEMGIAGIGVGASLVQEYLA